FGGKQGGVAVVSGCDQVTADGPIGSATVQGWSDAYLSSRIADAVWFPEGRTSFAGKIRRRPLADLTFLEIEADPHVSGWHRDSVATQYVGTCVSTRTFAERVTLGDSSDHVISKAVSIWDNADLVETEILSPMAQTIVLVPKRVLPLRGRGAAPTFRDASFDP